MYTERRRPTASVTCKDDWIPVQQCIIFKWFKHHYAVSWENIERRWAVSKVVDFLGNRFCPGCQHGNELMRHIMPNNIMLKNQPSSHNIFIMMRDFCSSCYTSQVSFNELAGLTMKWNLGICHFDVSLLILLHLRWDLVVVRPITNFIHICVALLMPLEYASWRKGLSNIRYIFLYEKLHGGGHCMT